MTTHVLRKQALRKQARNAYARHTVDVAALPSVRSEMWTLGMIVAGIVLALFI